MSFFLHFIAVVFVYVHRVLICESRASSLMSNTFSTLTTKKPTIIVTGAIFIRETYGSLGDVVFLVGILM